MWASPDPQNLNEYKKEFRSNIVALFETTMSGHRANSVVAHLGFDKSFHVEAYGFARKLQNL